MIRPPAGPAHGNVRRFAVELHTVPAEAADLLPAHAGEKPEPDHGLHRQAADGSQERVLLGLGEGLLLLRRLSFRADPARGQFLDHARLQGGVEDLLKDHDGLLLTAPAQVAASGQDGSYVVAGDVAHGLLTDHGADHFIDLIPVQLLRGGRQKGRTAGIPARGVLIYKGVLRRAGSLGGQLGPADRDFFAELRLGEAVHVLPLPVRAADPLPVVLPARAVFLLRFVGHVFPLPGLPNLAAKSAAWYTFPAADPFTVEGGGIMSYIDAFVLSVAASVVAYYICKWLDGE